MQAKRIGEMLRQIGASNSKSDTLLAHITPEEAALLKRRGGSGRIDPDTGLPHFDEGSDNNDSATGDTNSGSDQSTYSDGGQEDVGSTEAPPGPDQNWDGSFNPDAFDNSSGKGGPQYTSDLLNQYGWAPDDKSGYWTSPNANMGFGNVYGDNSLSSGYDFGSNGYDPSNQVGNYGKGGVYEGQTAKQGTITEDMQYTPDEINGLSNYNFSGSFGPESRSEYSGLSAKGDFDNYITNYGNNDWGINWGAIGHDVVGAMNSAPGMAIGSMFLGPAYAAAAKSSHIGLNAYADANIGRGYEGTKNAALNSLGVFGGLAGGPVGAAVGGAIGQAGQGNYGNAVGNLASYALAGQGLDALGARAGYSQWGPMGAVAGGMAGKAAQDYAISQELAALGIQNGMSLSGSIAGSAFDTTPVGSSADISMFSLDGGAGSTQSDSPSYGVYQPGQMLGSSGGGADLGSVYLQRIKDLYKNQTGAFEEQKRKTWYRDDNTMGGLTGSPWRRI